MTRTCDSCGEEYESHHSRSRFCSTRCRVRNSRRRAQLEGKPTKPASRADVVRVVAPDENQPHVTAAADLHDAALAELRAAGRVDTALGQAALLLARRAMERQTTGSAVATLVKELRATLDLALAAGEVAGDNPLDELRRRRDERKRAAGSRSSV